MSYGHENHGHLHAGLEPSAGFGVAGAGDDGPTAAIVAEGLVAFNTESCTVIVVDAMTGEVVWQEWLGDPLMSQPAIDGNRLYIAYPSRGRDHRERGHKLLCAELRTGKHLWEQEITADVITAPVVSEQKVYFTCFDGTSFCLDGADGKIVWKNKDGGTSAPLVIKDRVYRTHKLRRGLRTFEVLRHHSSHSGGDQHDLAESPGEYLTPEKDGGVAIKGQALHHLDASVGFSAAPAAAKLNEASAHVGVKTVAGGWAFQGSKAAYAKKRVMNAQGRNVHSLHTEGGSSWRVECSALGADLDDQLFSPPAIGKDYMYLCSMLGHVLSIRQEDGQVGFSYSTQLPMAFQPALARGRVYAGTVNGLLLCVDAGTDDADGWHMWGGNAQHNRGG